MSNRTQRRQLAKDLGVRRGLVKGPAAGDKPTIYQPEPEGMAHGQLLMAGNLASNFVEYPWRGIDSLRDFATRLHEFLLGEEPYLEFLSPHDGEIHLLTRVGAMSIVAINHARAKGPVDARGLARDSKIVRVGGSLPAELLRG